MGASFFYKLFLSTVGSLPSQYDAEVDSWWGIVLTELGLLDPFREENCFHFLVKFLCTFFFVSFLLTVSLCNAYKNIRDHRDEAREHSKKGAYESCNLHAKLRDTENELYRASEKLQDADSDVNEERKEFRNTIQGLNDQFLVDQEKIRSLEQDVWNTESDRDGYCRQVFQGSKENRTLKLDLSEAIHQRNRVQGEGQTLQGDLSEVGSQRDLAQAEVQTLQEKLSEITRQRDLAQGEVQTLRIQVEPQQGRATSFITSLKAQPKPKHRRTQRPCSLPKPRKKLLLKGSKAARPSTSSFAGSKSPPNLIGENLSRGMFEAALAEKEQKIKDLQAQIQTATVEAGAEAEQKLRDMTPEVFELEASITVNDQKTSNSEKKTRTAQVGELRTDIGYIREEHGECSGDLHAQLARKDKEIRKLRTEKATADKDSAETIATLRIELGGQVQEVADVEDANGALAADPAPFADTVQRLNTLSEELEVSQRAHTHCEENSTSQNSRIGQLMTAKEQLEETLRVKNGEIESLQRRVHPLDNELAQLQGTHAKCDEHVNTQGLEITQLRNANVSLQETIDDLSQKLQIARDEHASLIHEGRRLEDQIQASKDLHVCSQSEVRSLQSQVEAMTQTVDDQQQRIQTLETNCPKCQKLREALDEVTKDVEMSDDNTRAEMKREVTMEVRAELRSQVPDDLRRQIRGEVEQGVREEFQNHFSGVLTSNTRRLQEQERLLSEKDAKLEKAKRAPTLNHTACEQREGNLQSTITKLKQDAMIATRNHSRMNGDAQHQREQLRNAQKTTEDLRSELETIKADQRRAQNVNPLQGKIRTCQRELESMKVDRDKARENCSTYSKLLSGQRKDYAALESKFAAFKEKGSLDDDSIMDEGRTEEPPVAGQNEQRTAASDTDKSTISILQNKVADLSKELEERKERNNVHGQVMENHHTLSGHQSLPDNEGEQQWPEGSFPDGRSSAAPAMGRDEAAALDLLGHEVIVREARDGKKKAVCTQSAASASPTVHPVERSTGGLRQSLTQNCDDEADDKPSLPIERGEKSDDELEEGEIVDTKLEPEPASMPARRSAHPSACEPTTKPVLGGGAGKKREYDEYSDVMADEEGGDERKKVKITVIEDGIQRLKASRDSSAPEQGEKPQEDKSME